MKLATFHRVSGDASEIGAVLDTGDIAVLDPRQDSAFASMLSLIDAGEAGLESAASAIDGAERLPLADIVLLAPLPEPRQMRDSLCFEKHLRQARANRHLFGLAPRRIEPADMEIPAVWYEQPIYYKCNRFSVSGPEAEIRWPSGETRLDFELEMAVVLSRKGRDIPAEQADRHIFGFTIFNDFSARDHQMREVAGGLGPAKGKDFDTGNVLGPWIVTRDEIGDFQNLRMSARLNGETLAEGNSSEMQHSFRQVIAHVSRDETLYPGEVICSGTLGDGCGLEHARFLEPGDVVELEIERIGILRNTVGPRHESLASAG